MVRDGDFVGVAAPSESQAARALAAIKAEWKPGPRISGKDLFDDLKKPGGRARARGRARRRGGSANRRVRSRRDSMLADVRLEQTYTIAYIAHAPLEPRAAVAQWENGKLTVWTGTQRPFGVRGELAGAFRLADDCRARDRPRHRFRLRRQAHGRSGRRGRATRPRGRQARQARLDPRGRIHVGLFPARRGHRDQERRDATTGH